MKELLHEWERGFEPMLSASQRYRKTSNISRTLIGNKMVDHSDVVGASPVGAAPTTSSFSTWQLASRKFCKDSRKTVRESFKCWDLVRLILETWRYLLLPILVAIMLTIQLWLFHKKRIGIITRQPSTASRPEREDSPLLTLDCWHLAMTYTYRVQWRRDENRYWK